MFRILIYLLYWTLQAAAFPFLLLYLGYRVARNRAYATRLAERFGFWTPPSLPTSAVRIWFHAVSVGEILTLVPLLKRLKQALPSAQVYVSTATLAGRAIADSKLMPLVDGVFFAPVDYRFAVRRVLRRIRPSVVVVMETEIWPNLFRDARLSGARLLVVNARISDEAVGRYRALRWFFAPVVAYADTVQAQGEIARQRYAELGAEPVNSGNLKYDFDPSVAPLSAPVRDWLEALPAHLTWIAASTMPPAAADDPDEDDVVIEAFLRLRSSCPHLLLVLVPRRPERFASAATKLAAAHVPFVRRTQLAALELPGALLLDTVGELAGLFSRADVVFMGGSIVNRGGHNPVEPAAFGVPVVAGPHMENFAEIAAELTAANALVRIGRAGELSAAVAGLLSDPAQRQSIGARARELADRRRGTTQRAVEEIVRLVPSALPVTMHSWVRLAVLGPLSFAWRAVLGIDRRRCRPAKLTIPVVSVGNLAVGGTAKTPLVIWLAQRLASPAVLTRGYGRSSGEVVVAPAGAQLSVEETGEEAQLILRHAAIGVCADRRTAAARLLSLAPPPQVFVLDDGFQHWRLQRDIDLVLIDVIDPLRGGVLPLGRLREPFSALRRATAVILTRAEPGQTYTALRNEIAKVSPGTPVFMAQTVAVIPDLPQGLVGAFCGLGQPASFAETLRQSGIQPVFFRSFPDHHRYKEAELREMSARAAVLLTTEKDLLNIPAALVSQCNVHAVRIELQIDAQAELLALLRSRGIVTK